jgi:hypothetical protein
VPLEQLVDHIINAQSEGSSREKENGDATSEVFPFLYIDVFNLSWI